MEYVYGLASSLTRDLVCGTVNQLRYPCCFNKFIKEIAKENDDLIATRNSVQERVVDAKKQTRKTTEVVHKWLKDAKVDEDSVNHLLKEARKRKSCCFGHCPNWIWQYRLGKKLANKKGDIERCIEEGKKYMKLERVATLPSTLHDYPSERCLNFESRQHAYEQVMEALKDDGVSRIGLYGMGGCGKTTLAMEIRNTVEAEHFFDQVLFVPVSNTVEVRRIQEKIASSLGYKFPENEEMERAKRLHTRLTEENKILLILDDVWQMLDFRAIGVPSAKHHKGCKVLITTRLEEVCTLMDCQNKIQLQVLTNEEAWTLFHKQAHISEDTSDTLKNLAREISDECKGLPVAIAAVASSLKGKAEVIWRVALNKLRNSKPINIEKGLSDPYKCLQLSYDNLDTEESRSLFLLCSVFPEDSEIPVEVLTRCAIGLGVAGEVHSYEEARNEVIAAKMKLISSCLLLDVDDKCVKMHDLVRDVAHLIAKNKNGLIQCELEKDMTSEQNSVIYLYCRKFSIDLDSSNLEFLCIKTKLEIADEIFGRMGKLRVLMLHNDGEGKLPLSTISFKTLTNLRYLMLSNWKFSDISFVRDMRKLQSLSLHECTLHSLLELQTDDVVTQLKNWKLLVLYQCEMERNNFEVLRKIPQLEELCIINSKDLDDYNENTIEFFKTFSVSQSLKSYVIKLGSKVVPDERYCCFSNKRTLLLNYFLISNEAIKGLAKKAKVLLMTNIQGGAKNIIPEIFQMKEGNTNELKELQICNSEEIEYLVDTSNHLTVMESIFSKLLELRINRMNHLRVLWHGCLSPYGSFEKLEKLYLSDCPQLTSLFTHAIARCLVQLKELEIFRCERLKHILANDGSTKDEFKDELPVQSIIFQNLEKMVVSECKALKHVFSTNTMGGLPQLKTLKIEHCCQLDQIIEDMVPLAPITNNPFAHQNQKQELDEIIEDEQHQRILYPGFEGNQSENSPESTSIPSTLLVNHSPGSFTLSSLTSIILESCPKLSSLFTTSTAKTLTSLELLTIQDCDGLKHILTRERAHNNQKENIVEDDHGFKRDISMLITLKKLYIRCDLLHLQHVFSISGPVKLKDRRNEETPDLKYVFGQNNLEENSCHLQQKNMQIGQQVSLGLEEFQLVCLPQMTYIWMASKNSFTLQYLKTLHIQGCPKLKVIFPQSVLRCLPELERLEVFDCKELKLIIEDAIEDKTLSNFFPTQPCFPKLVELVVHQCCKLKRLFTVYASNDLPNLEILIISGATELEQLIGCEQGASKNSFTFRNLKTLKIGECAKLKVIFPRSILRCLPELKHLKINECEELKQIMEEDVEVKKVSNLLSPQPCFPKLASLVVEECHKLKRFLCVSTSNDLPNLEALIINGANELEELIGDEIGKAKLELPNLKLLLFMHLSTFRQGTEFMTVKHRFIHNCPKLSLTSSTTLLELRRNFLHQDFENIEPPLWTIYPLFDQIIEPDAVCTEKATIDHPIDLNSRRTSSSELPSSQIIEESGKEFNGKDPGSVALSIATPTYTELNERPSPSPLDTSLLESHSHEFADRQSMSRASYLADQQKPLGETKSSMEIPQERDPIIKKASIQMNQDLATSKSELPSSQVDDNNQTVLGNIPQIVYKHKQIESRAIVSESYEFLELERESKKTPHLQPLRQKLSPVSSSNLIQNIEEIRKEKIQEWPASEEATVKTLSAGVESINLGKNVQIQQGVNLMDKTKRIGIISNDSTEVPPGYFSLIGSFPSYIYTRLGTYKHFVDLNDAQIALLVEAIVAYPHLWSACEKFSERFQAWMLKTLADMLLFLRNESVVSVTPQSVKEFHKLCDEAAQLGFKRSWVDEMRQRVVARDPEVDHAQARIGELRKRHDHLTQELCNIQNELNSLNHFVDAQTKCFDFL